MSTSADLLNGDSRLQRRLRRQTRSAGDSTQEIRPISEEPKQVDPSTIDENSDPNVQDSSSESKIHRRGLKGKDRLSSSPLAKRLRLRDFDSAFSNTSASGIKEKSFLHRKNRLGAGAFGKNSQFDDFRFRKSVSTEDTRLLSGNSSCESFEHGSIADLRSTDRSTETILSRNC